MKIIELGKQLNRSFEGRHIYGKLFRAGTSSGANFEESHADESTNDFLTVFGRLWIWQLVSILKNMDKKVPLVSKSTRIGKIIEYNPVYKTRRRPSHVSNDFPCQLYYKYDSNMYKSRKFYTYTQMMYIHIKYKNNINKIYIYKHIYCDTFILGSREGVVTRVCLKSN